MQSLPEILRLLQRLVPVNGCRAPMWSQKAVFDGEVCDADRWAMAASRARRSCSIPGARPAGTQTAHQGGEGGSSRTSRSLVLLRVVLFTALARSAMVEPQEAANETVGSVDETVDRRESSMAVQVLVMLAGIGCVVLYVVVKRWSHRRAVAKARQESEEMQRSPRHFTADEYAPAALDSDARRRPNPLPSP